ncbi:hypothetical protein [Rhizobium sp. Root149]|uniref:hypothetical protein n=1 Tax=Rhizobium sp. Root149 TaxID=1736473 RepID=UPI001FCDFB15|nr:hypothetical protein [Rhizobium sp. Root149]
MRRLFAGRDQSFGWDGKLLAAFDGGKQGVTHHGARCDADQEGSGKPPDRDLPPVERASTVSQDRPIVSY